jgi:hypothetical protein
MGLSKGLHAAIIAVSILGGGVSANWPWDDPEIEDCVDEMIAIVEDKQEVTKQIIDQTRYTCKRMKELSQGS